MNKSTYDKIAHVLKVLSKIVGTIFIGYGCVVGVLGIGPDGPTAEFGLRFIGLFLLFQGVLCFFSNSKIRSNPHLSIIYLVLTSAPGLIIISSALFAVATSGINSFVRDGGLVTVIVLLPISVFAPLSLVFYSLGQKDKMDGT